MRVVVFLILAVAAAGLPATVGAEEMEAAPGMEASADALCRLPSESRTAAASGYVVVACHLSPDPATTTQASPSTPRQSAVLVGCLRLVRPTSSN